MDFEEYSRMAKKSERNATLASESPEKKSILWKQHFAYQETKLALSERQKKFLNDLSEYLDEDFFCRRESRLVRIRVYKREKRETNWSPDKTNTGVI